MFDVTLLLRKNLYSSVLVPLLVVPVLTPPPLMVILPFAGNLTTISSRYSLPTRTFSPKATRRPSPEARRAVCGGYIRLGVKLAAEALMK